MFVDFICISFLTRINHNNNYNCRLRISTPEHLPRPRKLPSRTSAAPPVTFRLLGLGEGYSVSIS